MARSFVAVLMLLVAGFLMRSGTALAQTNPLATVDDAMTDLLVTGWAEPLRVRLVVTVGGIPWREQHRRAQEEHVRSLFAQLDANGNGGLEVTEAVRIPSAQSFGTRDPDSEIYVAFNFKVLDRDHNGSASFEELTRYLSGFGGMPLQLATPKVKPDSGDLFRWLDGDQDGFLVEREWAQWESLLERDQDGNGVLVEEELRRPSESLLGPEFVAVPLARAGAFKPLSVKRAKPEGMADVVLHVELTNPLVRSTPGRLAVEMGVTLTSHGPFDAVLQHGNGRLQFQFLPPPSRQSEYRAQAVRREFNAAHERTMGNVTADADLPPLLKSLLSLADGNGDGKLERNELEECLAGLVAAQQKVDAMCLRLAIFPERRGLCSLLDDNLDGRLSRHELARLPQALTAIANGDGAVSRESTPTTVSLILQQSPGQTTDAGSILLDSGPPWYFRADTNRDGGLSPSEFLGPPETFTRLDLNTDGAIDLFEAIQSETARAVSEGGFQ